MENKLVLQQENRQYCCAYDDCVYFYANSQAYRCDFDCNILESQPCMIESPKVKKRNEIVQYDEDESQFFITHKFSVNGTQMFISNYFNDVVVFNKFEVNKIASIPGYVQDRIINKVAVVRNIIFVSSSVSVYKLTIGNDFQQRLDNVSFEQIDHIPNLNTIKIYNIFDQLVIRDGAQGKMWVLGPNNIWVQQCIQAKRRMNLFVANQPYSIYAYDMDNNQQLMFTFENNEFIIKSISKLKKFEVKYCSTGFLFNDQDQIKLSNMTQAEYQSYIIDQQKIVSDSIKIGQSKFETLQTSTSYFPSQLLQFSSTETKLHQRDQELIPLLLSIGKQDIVNEYLMQYPVTSPHVALHIIYHRLDANIQCEEISMTSLFNHIMTTYPNTYHFAHLLKNVKRPPLNLLKKVVETHSHQSLESQLLYKNVNNTNYTKQELVALFVCAVRGNNVDGVDYFKSICSPADMDDCVSTPLKVAIQQNNLQLCQSLIQYKLINQSTSELHICAQEGRTDMIDLFIDQVGRTNSYKETALMIAVKNNFINIVNKLVPFESGMRDDKQRTSLMLALLNKNWEVARLLYHEANKIDINRKFATAYCTYDTPNDIFCTLIHLENYIVISQPNLHLQQKLQYYTIATEATLDDQLICNITGRTLRQRIFHEQGYFNLTFCHDISIQLLLMNDQWENIDDYYQSSSDYDM